MGLRVEFRKSERTLDWEDAYENLLELADANGIVIDSSCQQGFCGTCKVKLLAGQVAMESTDGLDDHDIKENMILACEAVPKTDIVVEA